MYVSSVKPRDLSIKEMVIALLIVANAIFIGISGQVQIRSTIIGKQQSDWVIVDYIFTAIFAGELLLRALQERSLFFRGRARAWNLFDSLVLLLDVASKPLGTHWPQI